MATQTKTDPITESVETAAERVAELNEKAVANGKKASAAILDTYEKAVVSFTESGRAPCYRRGRRDWRVGGTDHRGATHLTAAAPGHSPQAAEERPCPT